jgi:hypothetical protein
VGSATCDLFEELSHSGKISHHHLMKQEKSDETARDPLLEKSDGLKKVPKIQP